VSGAACAFGLSPWTYAHASPTAWVEECLVTAAHRPLTEGFHAPRIAKERSRGDFSIYMSAAKLGFRIGFVSKRIAVCDPLAAKARGSLPTAC
jgi:hypothetical protein